MKELGITLALAPLMAFVIGAIGCNGGTETPTPAPTPTPTLVSIFPSFNDYYNPEYEYSITYPSAWTLQADETEKVYIKTPYKTISQAIVFIYVRDIPSSISLDRYAQEWPYQVHDDYLELDILSINVLDNQWDWLLEYKITDNEGEVDYYETYFKKVGSYIYILEAASLSSTRSPMLQDIIDSFQISK
jgi:hypothetical protein